MSRTFSGKYEFRTILSPMRRQTRSSASVGDSPRASITRASEGESAPVVLFHHRTFEAPPSSFVFVFTRVSSTTAPPAISLALSPVLLLPRTPPAASSRRLASPLLPCCVHSYLYISFQKRNVNIKLEKSFSKSNHK